MYVLGKIIDYQQILLEKKQDIIGLFSARRRK